MQYHSSKLLGEIKMKPKIRTLNESQAAALMQGTWGRWGERDRQIVVFILHTGLKIREFVNLNVGDAYTGKRVRKTARVKSSIGLPERRVPLDRAAREAIAVILDFSSRQGFSLEPDQPLVVSRQKNRKNGSYRITTRQVQRIMKTLSEDAELEFKTTPQTLRHTFAAAMLRDGKEMKLLQQLLGHRSIKTTRDLYGAHGRVGG